jgi:phage protein D
MPRLAQNVSHVFVKIGGAELPPEIQSSIIEVVVDQNAHLPDMFTINIYDDRDRDTGKLKVIDNDKFDLGKTVKIESLPDNETNKVTLFEGEITALEPSFGEAMATQLLVRGYDKSHRGFREVKSITFLNEKDSDIASKLAGEAGLSPNVDTTSEVYDHIYQNNQSSLSFLLQRAWRIGYECYVEDGKLNFKKPPTGGEKCTLEYGIDLASFNPRMTVSEQVTEVVVKGWDPKGKKAIVGKSTTGSIYAKIGISEDGGNYASKFGASKQTIVDHPVQSQAEANAIAKARLDEISGSFVEAEGRAIRRPDIRAGKHIELKGLGTRFSGTYLVTSATHRWSGSGMFTTDFVVSGTRSGTFIERLTKQDPVNRWTGVVSAVVTDTEDPDKWGRVKLKYPWMDDEQQSHWARIVSVGAGGENSGIIAVPYVDDEVLVAFEQGDFNRPYVLGGLWNGKDKPPPDTTDASGEIPKVRSWRSRTGHYISMYDNDDKKIEVATNDGHTITLDDKNKQIVISSPGGMTLTVDDNAKSVKLESAGDVTIESKGNMNFNSTGDMKLNATKNMTLEAKLNMTVKGLQLAAEGKVKAELKGVTVAVQGSALTEIKGALVKIN